MIRVVVFLALVALLAFGAVWVADRPGDVAITWQGWRIETSLAVTMVAVVVVIAATMLAWSLLRTILRSPDLIGIFLSHRRGVRGYLAISRGLIAVGAGDATAARKFASEAERIAPGEPLALLLNAQCAQLAGDRAAAEASFRAMAERDETKLIGLRGLYVEARRRGDVVAARGYAEEAALTAPNMAWAGQAVLDFRCASGDWAGALAALDRNSKHDLIDRAAYRRQRAVLLTARALSIEESDRDRAKNLALEAVKLAPSLVPAAELAARLLGDAGDFKRASRIVETAWKANPHPDLAEAFAHLRLGDSARERLARIESLVQKTPGNIEGALAVARAAIDAHEFGVARVTLKPLTITPTKRVAALMAEIEERDSGDEGRAREWMSRALRAPPDPAWTAEGHVSDRWMPVSPSGRLDAFEWKVPLAELGDGTDEHDVIDARPPPEPPRPAGPDAPLAEEPKALPAAEPPRPRRRKPQASADAVIPLVHVPDDPGPDASHEPDPEPEPRLLK